MAYPIKFRHFNETSILIEWPLIIEIEMLHNILNFKNLIKNKYAKQKVEIISTYNSLCVIYDCTIDNINSEISLLKSLYSDVFEDKETQSQVWQVPVCYDDEFALDLEAFSKAKKLSKDTIVKLHTAPIYTIFFIGFLPGFLYLGGLDSELYLDRKSTPDLGVKKGAVAIGGKQTGIYPQNSPGGWHIIGSSPIDFFNPKLNPPCKIKPGDGVKFISIDKKEYQLILEKKKTSKYGLINLSQND